MSRLLRACALALCSLLISETANANCYIKNSEDQNLGALRDGQNVTCDGAAPNPETDDIKASQFNIFGITVKLTDNAQLNHNGSDSIVLFDQSTILLSG